MIWKLRCYFFGEAHTVSGATRLVRLPVSVAASVTPQLRPHTNALRAPPIFHHFQHTTPDIVADTFAMTDKHGKSRALEYLEETLDNISLSSLLDSPPSQPRWPPASQPRPSPAKCSANDAFERSDRAAVRARTESNPFVRYVDVRIPCCRFSRFAHCLVCHSAYS